MKPYVVGDTRNVVAIIHVDYNTLTFLANELPQNDGYTKELQKLLIKIDEGLEALR